MPVDPDIPRASDWVVSVSAVFPHHANPVGTMFGGHVLQLMDVNASIACNRYCRRVSVTASTEPVDFRSAVHVGDILEVRSRVAWVGTTSMIVRSEVVAESPTTGARRVTTVGHLNFVALDDDGAPTRVPALDLRNDEERQQYRVAQGVREAMLARRMRGDDRATV
jgi:Acyl-CoA hydrolase